MAGRFSLTIREASFSFGDGGARGVIRDLEVSGAVTPDGLAVIGSLGGELLAPPALPPRSRGRARGERMPKCTAKGCGKTIGRWHPRCRCTDCDHTGAPVGAGCCGGPNE